MTEFVKSLQFHSVIIDGFEGCLYGQELKNNSRSENFPITFFAMVIGLAGLTIAWKKAQHLLGRDLHINSGLVGLTTAVFAVLTGFYVGKFLRYRAAVAGEFSHPVKLNFFPTFSISLLLLAIAFLSLNSDVSRPLWLIGTSLHLLFTLDIVNVWIHHEHFDVHHLNPAWFIPAVGNVLVPVAGIPLGYSAYPGTDQIGMIAHQQPVSTTLSAFAPCIQIKP